MTDAEVQARELPALVSAIARAKGLSQLPPFRSDAAPVDLPELSDAIPVLSDPKSTLPAHARLEALGRLVEAQQRETPGTAVDLMPLAEALTKDENAAPLRRSAAEAMLEQLKKTRVQGRDRLGRAVMGNNLLLDPELPSLVSNLHVELQSDVAIVSPLCGIKTTNMDGVPALNIITDVSTPRPLSDFWRIVNPREWTKCALESGFFTEMSPVPPGVEPGSTLPPDDGWKGTLLEVVDFGFGIPPRQEVKTELNFVFFFNPTVPGRLGCAGSTYDFHRSLDDQISVDQGFLLAEDLGPPTTARPNRTRYRTQKLVHMKNGTSANDDVCDVWSAIVGVLLQGCSGGPPAPQPATTTPTSTPPTTP